jgi:hypothetical protein
MIWNDEKKEPRTRVHGSDSAPSDTFFKSIPTNYCYAVAHRAARGRNSDEVSVHIAPSEFIGISFSNHGGGDVEA